MYGDSPEGNPEPWILTLDILYCRELTILDFLTLRVITSHGLVANKINEQIKMLLRPWRPTLFPANTQAQERVDGDNVQLYLSSVLPENNNIKKSLQPFVFWNPPPLLCSGKQSIQKDHPSLSDLNKTNCWLFLMSPLFTCDKAQHRSLPCCLNLLTQPDTASPIPHSLCC